jgi:hypothetical protein
MAHTRTRTNRSPDARREIRRSAHPVRGAGTAAASRELTREDRVREAGGPQDVAHYHCSCGKRFSGAVSTQVACPACGTGQAW